MKTQVLISIFFIVLFSMLKSYGQETASYSLKEAQDYALKNNIKIKNAQLDIESAKKKIWETTAMGLPQVKASLSYTYLPTIPEMAFSTPTYGILQPDNKTVLLEYMEIPLALGVANSTTIDATVSQLVFNGAYIVGLQASKIFQRLSEQSLELSENEIIESVSNAYYLVLVMEENIEILKGSKKNIDTTLYEITKMYEQGFVENTDVDQLKYTASIIDNTLKTMEQQAKIAYKLLKFNMGIDLNSEIELTEDLETIVNEISNETLVIDEYDISQNITYQLLETQEALQELNLKREKSAFLPSVVAFYNHQEKTNKADFDFTMPDMIGVNVDVPIFSSWQRMAKVKQAEIELVKTRNSKEMAIEGLNLQVQQAQITLKSSMRKYLIEKSNLELTQKIYDKTLLKYSEGISTSMELTQASSQQLTAQANYFTAVNEFLQAKSKLDNLLNKK